MECPGFERLIDYCDGLLGDPDAQFIATHIASGCRQCAEDCRWYDRMRALAARDVSLAPPPWVLKRALKLLGRNPARPTAVKSTGRLVASLIFDSLSQPDLAGVRLAEISNRQLLYRAGDYSIDMQIVLSDKTNADLFGQILRENESRFESVAGLPLGLSREGMAVRSTHSNEVGEFTISGVKCDEYELVIETREAVLIIPRMPITPH